LQYTTKGCLASVLEKENTISAFIPNIPYILIVDDDDAILTVVMLLLETEGYTGLGFSSSQKVLPFLEQVGPKHLPAVILLDLMMPGMSGYEIALQLSQREQYANIPVVIMTADNRVQSASVVPGSADFISKPFQMATLLSKVGHNLT
jgi:CheY-like chemotaxis protein